MSEKNDERVGIPSYFSKSLSIPSIGDFSAPFGNFSPVTEIGNNSTKNPPTEPPPPPGKTLITSLPTVGMFSPISESVNNQTEDTLIAPNLPEQNNSPVVMVTPHPCTLRGEQLPEVIVPDHNVQPKLKSQAGFVRNNAVLCHSIYLYHNEGGVYEPMEGFT